MADLAHTENDPMSFDQYFDYFIGKFGHPPMDEDDEEDYKLEATPLKEPTPAVTDSELSPPLQPNPLVQSMGTVSTAPATGDSLFQRKRVSEIEARALADPTSGEEKKSSLFGKLKDLF